MEVLGYGHMSRGIASVTKQWRDGVVGIFLDRKGALADEGTSA